MIVMYINCNIIPKYKTGDEGLRTCELFVPILVFIIVGIADRYTIDSSPYL